MKNDTVEEKIGMDELVLVKSLDDISVMFVEGVEYMFTNGVCRIPARHAEIMINSQWKGGRYIIWDGKNQEVMKSAEPSISNLEIEFQALMSDPKNLAPLRNWIRSKANQVEPALLGYQQQQSEPIVPTQQDINNAVRFKSGDVIPQPAPQGVKEITISTNAEMDVDTISVDGATDEPQQSSMERAEEALSDAGGKLPGFIKSP